MTSFTGRSLQAGWRSAEGFKSLGIWKLERRDPSRPTHHAAGDSGLVSGLAFGGGAYSGVQVAQQSVLQSINPAVHRELLAPFPGLARDRRLAHVRHLLDHVQF